jgi:predicted tellurium resistance membrane protein TerC
MILVDSAVGLFTVSSLVALLTLTALEIVLGIDNLVFLSILSGRLPAERQAKARRLGLLLAMGLRVALLLGITFVMGLTAPVLTLAGVTVTGRDLVLLAGGLFLIAKGTLEIHHLVARGGPSNHPSPKARAASFGGILAQIAVMDLVFSLDSVITAVGMAQRVEVMVAAVVAAIVVMMVFADPIARFVETHLAIKTLALAFLVLVGVLLVADGLHQHLPRGYVYFAMAFSLSVELLNLRVTAKRAPGARP